MTSRVPLRWTYYVLAGGEEKAPAREHRSGLLKRHISQVDIRMGCRRQSRRSCYLVEVLIVAPVAVLAVGNHLAAELPDVVPQRGVVVATPEVLAVALCPVVDNRLRDSLAAGVPAVALVVDSPLAEAPAVASVVASHSAVVVSNRCWTSCCLSRRRIPFFFTVTLDLFFF